MSKHEGAASRSLEKTSGSQTASNKAGSPQRELANSCDQRGKLRESEGRDDSGRTRKLAPWCNKFWKKTTKP